MFSKLPLVPFSGKQYGGEGTASHCLCYFAKMRDGIFSCFHPYATASVYTLRSVGIR